MSHDIEHDVGGGGILSNKVLWLCIGGLIAIFLTGYVGYYVLNTIWQTFLGTQPARENAWLLAYGISAGAYLIGIALTYISILDLIRYKPEKA